MNNTGEKYGGRRPGATNLVTARAKKMIVDILENNTDEFMERMSRLPDKEYCNTYIQLLKFAVPTMQAVKVEEAPTVNLTMISKIREASKNL